MWCAPARHCQTTNSEWVGRGLDGEEESSGVWCVGSAVSIVARPLLGWLADATANCWSSALCASPGSSSSSRLAVVE